jgi:hypothetical protein
MFGMDIVITWLLMCVGLVSFFIFNRISENHSVRYALQIYPEYAPFLNKSLLKRPSRKFLKAYRIE